MAGRPDPEPGEGILGAIGLFGAGELRLLRFWDIFEMVSGL